MDRSLNEAARDIGQAMQQLTDAMRDKGYPLANAAVAIGGPETFGVSLHTYGRGAFHNGFSYQSCTTCIGSTIGEAYTKADAAIAAMPDRAERAAS